MDSKDSRLEWARSRVRKLRDFYAHFFSYVLINAFLAVLDFWMTGRLTWSRWCLLGWGFGLAAHAMAVFVAEGFFGRGWEERKIRELLKKNGR